MNKASRTEQGDDVGWVLSVQACSVYYGVLAGRQAGRQAKIHVPERSPLLFKRARGIVLSHVLVAMVEV